MRAEELALAAFSLLVAIAWAGALALSLRNLGRVPKLTGSGDGSNRTTVSVIVPARNEASVLGKTLESLLAQEGVAMELIVVDDHSTDGTERIVSRYLRSGVVYVLPPRTPEGWMGKTWACHVGYLNSRGDWLVFLDADVRLKDRRLLQNALDAASSEGLDALSLIPRLSTRTLASKVMLPALLMLMYLLAPPSKSNDPRERLAFFFGAFIAVRREAYESVGGHAAVRGELLDDKALGELLKSKGRRTALLDASDRYEAEFAGGLRDHFGGLIRLFTQYALDEASRNGRPVGRLSKYLAGGLVFLGGPTALPLMAVVLASHPVTVGLCLSPILASLVAQAVYLRRIGERAVYALAAPVAHLVILSALIRVTAWTVRGKARVEWHGRKYAADLRRGGIRLEADR